jgi:hypothetical protein
VVLFQVRPKASADARQRLQIKWGFLWRLDGGYRDSNTCTNYHYGDTQSGEFELVSDDGVNWSLEWLDVWDDTEIAYANAGGMEWTDPRSTYWNQLEPRPSPIIWASAGKHHQYRDRANCGQHGLGIPGVNECADHCAGGAQRLANLSPHGTFTNVGEAQHPLLDDLTPFGYPGEMVWYASWRCRCGDNGFQDCFTGGTGKDWSASGWPQRCDVTSPVKSLFNLSDVISLPKEAGMLVTVTVTCL